MNELLEHLVRRYLEALTVVLFPIVLFTELPAIDLPTKLPCGHTTNDHLAFSSCPRRGSALEMNVPEVLVHEYNSPDAENIRGGSREAFKAVAKWPGVGSINCDTCYDRGCGSGDHDCDGACGDSCGN